MSEQKEYCVVWRVDVTADSREDAARQALAIQRDPNSTATVFLVPDEIGRWYEIDLTAIDEGDS